MSGTVENLRADRPGQALTGPVVRGDGQVVARHLEALADLSPDLDAAYRALATRALALARADRGLDADAAQDIASKLSPDDRP